VRLFTSTITGFLIFRAKLSNHAEKSLNALQLRLFFFFFKGRAGVAARPSWWKKIVQVALCFKCVNKIFLNMIVYPHTKLRGIKTRLICSRTTRELFNERT
jgi:hypothetical protein